MTDKTMPDEITWKDVQTLCCVNDKMCFPVDAILQGVDFKKCSMDYHADHIVTTLRKENARFREALGQISRMTTMPDDKINTITLVAAHTIARKALGEQDE